jgi:photosystem II stability/assembly factor-like uncharacterized protein
MIIKRNIIIFCVALLQSLLYLNTLFAQSNWQFLDQLCGTSVRTVFYYNDYIFAGTDGDGMYKFNFNTNSWNKLTGFPKYSSVYSITNNSKGHLYTTTSFSLYVSTNEGATWQQKPMNNRPVYVLLRDTTRNIIYAGSSGRILKSLDDGETWLIDTLADYSDVTSIDIDSDGNVYAGTWNGGLYKSDINGSNWQKITANFLSEYVTAVKCYKNNLFIGLFVPVASTTYGAIYKSSDKGNSWYLLHSFYLQYTYQHVNSIDIDENDNIYVATSYRGLYKSTNGGTNFFKLIGYPYGGINFVKYDIRSNELYAGTRAAGILKSKDLGNSWYELNEGMHNIWVDQIEADKDDNLFVGSTRFDWSIYKSTNYGASWENTSLHYGWTDLEGITTDLNQEIFVAATDVVYKYSSILKKWNNINGCPYAQYFNNDCLGNLYCIGYGFLQRSTNSGQVFLPLNNPYPYSFKKVICDYNKNLFGISEKMPDSSSVILMSTNNGAGWNTILDLNATEFSDISVDKNNFIYVGIINGGLLKTSDKGQNWITLRNEKIYDILIDDYDNMYISTGNRIQMSSNSGLSWIDYTTNLTPNGIIRKLAITKRGNLIASVEYQGLYRNNTFSYPVIIENFNGYGDNYNIFIYWNSVSECKNLGFEILRSFDEMNWESRAFIDGNQKEDSCISKQYFFDDSVEIDDTVHYKIKQISTDSLISFSHSISLIISTKTLIFNYILSQNYPNPFNSSTKIEFQIASIGSVTLKIYDILGNEVVTLVNEEKQPGTYEVEFNTSSIKHLPSSGIYFYQLRAGNFVETKKMVLIK